MGLYLCSVSCMQFHSAALRDDARTNRRSFSIKSTCVMIIRRQQYRLQPSWSIASLHICQSASACLSRRKHTHPEYPRRAAVDSAPTDPQPPVSVLSARLADSMGSGSDTFPQEKQRTGMIIWAGFSDWLVLAEGRARTGTGKSRTTFERQ